MYWRHAFRCPPSRAWFKPSASDVYRKIAAGDPSELPQRLLEHRDVGLPLRIVHCLRSQPPDPPHQLALLRARRKRPRCAAPPRSVMNERRFMASIRDLIPEEMDHAPVE